MIKCEFCEKSLSTKYNLVKHQKTARYCLRLQNTDPVGISCEFCSSQFTQKIDLERHHSICKYRIKQLEKDVLENTSNKQYIIKLESQIKELQDKLADVAKSAATRPTHIQNNNQRIGQITNNLIPITDQHFEDNAKFLTIDHIKNGAAGYAKYALEYPLKDRVVCMDFSRRKIGYKNSDGDFIQDPEMAKISVKLFNAIDNHNNKLITEYLRELQDKLFQSGGNTEMSESETAEFQIHTDKLLDYINQISSQKRDIKDIANGLKPEIYHDFIRNICSKTVP